MTENTSANSDAESVVTTQNGVSLTVHGGTFEWRPSQFSPMPYPELAVPVEVEDEPVEEDEDDDVEIAWEGVLGFEGHPTDDKRYLIPGEITERDMPLTLMGQVLSGDGHDNSVPVGRIDRIWRLAMPTVGPRAVAIMGSGVFDEGENGREFARLVDERVLRGVSFDLAVESHVPIDPVSFEPIPEDDPELPERIMSGDVLIGMAAKIMGATLVPFPAFADASVRVLASDHVLLASAHTITLTREAMTASAAGMAPVAPPLEWMFTPETHGPCPLTVTEDGRVFGHLATWDQCHTGFPNSCQLAPRSATDYRWFHLGAVLTTEGEQVPVGRITVGRKGHAPIGLDMNGAIEHYDRTGHVAAFVRAFDGVHGIWLSGVVRSDAPAELIRDLRANPPSGDWRRENGSLEMCAVLSVTKPGFPVPRAEYAMTASAGGDEEVTAVVAMLPVEAAEPMSYREAVRKRGAMTRRLRQSLSRVPPAA